MATVAPLVPALGAEPAARTVDELCIRFTQFAEAARRLEDAYHELRQRAERVDHELALANEALHNSLAERQRILEALPIAVFRRGKDTLLPTNAEAHRLAGAFARAVPARQPQPGGRAEPLAAEDDDGRPLRLVHRRIKLAEHDEWLDLVEDQTALAELESEVERLDRLSGLAELALGVAHEIRNPLNGLKGFAQMLRRAPRSPRAADWIAKIDEGAMRVERIVRDLLAFARPDGHADGVCRPLAAWLAEARADAPGLAIAADVAILALGVRGSRRALGKVLSNLLRNAAEAGARHVVVTATTRSGRVRIRMQDDGAGIAPELAGRLFSPFVGSKQSGSGLGLAFCARALQAMSGSIRNEPVAAGACFLVELPGNGELPGDGGAGGDET
jgi:two-component system sensor histidine kinase HydH